MHITVASCSGCGGEVRRLGAPQRAVLCPDCCRRQVDVDDYALIDDNARAMLDSRLAAFDTAGGYGLQPFTPSPSPARWEQISEQSVCHHVQHLNAGTLGRTGVLFIGPTGIGKTRAALSIARRIAETRPQGVWVLSETDLLNPSIPPWELIGHIQRAVGGRHTLIVDDIGTAARPVDQVMSAWKSVVDALFAASTPILFVGTTNRTTWDGLTDWMGAQATSRLMSFTSLATTGWTDRRSGLEHTAWRSLLTRPRTRKQADSPS